MLIIHSIDKRFTLFLRILGINVLRNFGQNRLVKWASDDFLVKLLYIEVQFIVQQLAIGDLTGYWIVNCNRIA